MKKIAVRNFPNRPDELRFTSTELNMGLAKVKKENLKSKKKSIVNYPMFFAPIYKRALWGGGMKTVRKNLPIGKDPISESWEISDRPDAQSIVSNGVLQGETLGSLIAKYPKEIIGHGHQSGQPFPLLIKIIDAAKDLSLQVHPNVDVCKKIPGSESKTECWYVLDHKKNAQIMSGVKDKVSFEEFKSKVNSDKIRSLMKTYESKVGDFYFIPANTMHAIGAGNLIFEVQQNSNTTFRVSDWGRLDQNGNARELHIEQALKCLKHKRECGSRNKIVRKMTPIIIPQDVYSFSEMKNLVRCDFFNVNSLHIKGDVLCANSFRTCMCLFALDEGIRIKHEETYYDLPQFKTCLIPAEIEKISLHTESHKNLLMTSL